MFWGLGFKIWVLGLDGTTNSLGRRHFGRILSLWTGRFEQSQFVSFSLAPIFDMFHISVIGSEEVAHLMVDKDAIHVPLEVVNRFEDSVHVQVKDLFHLAESKLSALLSDVQLFK